MLGIWKKAKFFAVVIGRRVLKNSDRTKWLGFLLVYVNFFFNFIPVAAIVSAIFIMIIIIAIPVFLNHEDLILSLLLLFIADTPVLYRSEIPLILRCCFHY